KSREFGEESPQNSSPERATIALGQGASEEAHFEANSTMPKTDSSGCFGIHHPKNRSGFRGPLGQM
ncbi:MAG: hypothetical protein KGI83_06555, partial [Verrucomicrobiota bacterium]|nr:hypothetical protein [Verrucomicrobiota bacterium]